MKRTKKKKKRKTHLIPQPQLLLAQLHTTPKTLRHRIPLLIQLPRKLQTHSTKPRIAFGVDTQRRSQLGDDVVEVSRFEACSCGGLGADKM